MDDGANAAWVVGLAPTAPHGVQVGAADAAIGDFNVNVGLFPLLRLELLPLQLAVHAVRAVAQPALEFVGGGHGWRNLFLRFHFIFLIEKEREQEN